MHASIYFHEMTPTWLNSNNTRPVSVVSCPLFLQRKPVRRRYESPGMYSDDDANSDASSACSERSYSSRNGGIPHYLRQTEDVAEVLNHCASSNWSERKEGLLGLQNLLKSQRVLR